jgi:5-methyltetrahydrofolate--homocysteine methyltransferase
MRGDLRIRLTSGPVLIADGATGTQLQQRGLPVGAPGELWTIEQPGAVREVAEAYADAGSDLVYTNSFGANKWLLARHNLADRAEELCTSAARLAREGVGEEVWVLGSMGTTGEFMEPLGTLTAKEVEEAFARQATALAEGGVDGLVLETFSALDEITAAARGARSAVDLPILATLTYGAGGRTMMGVGPGMALNELRAAGVDAVGLNCGDDIEVVLPVLAGYREADAGFPLVAKPNAGLPVIQGGKPVWTITPEQFAARAHDWIAAGARVVGGCCGTTPDYIAALAAALR